MELIQRHLPYSRVSREIQGVTRSLVAEATTAQHLSRAPVFSTDASQSRRDHAGNGYVFSVTLRDAGAVSGKHPCVETLASPSRSRS